MISVALRLNVLGRHRTRPDPSREGVVRMIAFIYSFTPGASQPPSVIGQRPLSVTTGQVLNRKLADEREAEPEHMSSMAWPCGPLSSRAMTRMCRPQYFQPKTITSQEPASYLWTQTNHGISNCPPSLYPNETQKSGTNNRPVGNWIYRNRVAAQHRHAIAFLEHKLPQLSMEVLDGSSLDKSSLLRVL